MRLKFKSVAAALAMVMVWAIPHANSQSILDRPEIDDQGPYSTCIALAENLATELPVQFASFGQNAGFTKASKLDEVVTISYSGHSTYTIDTPQGVRIATDYAGYAKGRKPDVATMNNAHSSHYTSIRDPQIGHMLPGWSADGISPVRHRQEVGDVFVRNVTTDINRFGDVRLNQNSIFIFETAGLCIGHLGHLHHRLTDTHFAEIGRLDIVMVPVDGGLTMGRKPMAATIDRLKSRVVLPMHRRGNSMTAFTDLLPNFAVEYRPETELKLSARTLPKTPTIIILPGV